MIKKLYHDDMISNRKEMQEKGFIRSKSIISVFKIEKARLELHRTICQYGCIDNIEIIKMSQNLDDLFLEYADNREKVRKNQINKKQSVLCAPNEN